MSVLGDGDGDRCSDDGGIVVIVHFIQVAPILGERFFDFMIRSLPRSTASFRESLEV